MTSFNLPLKNDIENGTSRHSGRIASAHIFSLLELHEVIEIDFKDITLTPSIADEVIGVLAEKLGKLAFKQRIKIKNASATEIALLKHVIARRLHK